MHNVKPMDYLEAIATYHPDAEVVCYGDPDVYENIIWERGSILPSKSDLDLIIFKDLKDKQIQTLSESCQLQITSGFQSSALGTPNMYDSEEVDQLNIVGSVTTISPTAASPDGYSTPYAVRPVVNGVVQAKTYALHNYAQLRQAMSDGAQYKLGCLIKFNTKRDYVNNNCSTIAQVLGVTWDSIES